MKDETGAIPPLPDDVMRLLDAERAAPPPSEAVRARILARLSTTLDLPPDGGGGPGGGSAPGEGEAGPGGGGTPAGGEAAGLVSGLLKPMTFMVFAAGVVVGGGGVAVLSGTAPDEPAPPAVASPAAGDASPSPAVEMGTRPVGAAPADADPDFDLPAATEAPPLPPAGPDPVAIPPSPEQAEGAPPPGRSSRPRAAVGPSVPSPGAEPSTADRDGDPAAGTAPGPMGDPAVAEERALLEVARTALARGRYAAALEGVEAHRARFPEGRFVEEREALAILALAGLGEIDAAEAAAEAFRSRHPTSLFLPVIDAALD